MAFSSEEINRISGSRLAIQGRKYIEENGNVWLGTKDNRLSRQYLKDTQVGVELNIQDPTTSLKKYLQDLKVNLIVKEKSIEIDFGNSNYVTEKEFVILDSDVLTTSNVIAQIAYQKSSNKELDDVAMDEFEIKSVISTGKVTVNIISLTGSVYGKYILNYFITI